MQAEQAIEALAALAQEHRLAAFRQLVVAGKEGLSAGALARRLGIAPSSLSFHLAQLARAGLVRARREGRFLFYCADYAAMNALMAYLGENCCGGETCEASAPIQPAPPAPERGELPETLPEKEKDPR